MRLVVADLNPAINDDSDRGFIESANVSFVVVANGRLPLPDVSD